MELKEININELNNYKDPFSLWEEANIALCDDGTRVNGLTLGWGSIGILWNKPCATIYINEARFSRQIFSNGSYFSINFLSHEYKEELKYFGTVSGKDVNKIKESKLETLYHENIPYFKEAELVIFCKKMTEAKFDIDMIKDDYDRIIKWYQKDGVHTIYFGEIIKIFKK